MPDKKEIMFFLSGDVMTGRGIDQILSHQSHPTIFEPYLKDARDYVQLAEEINGRIGYPVSNSYIWGFSLEEFLRLQPDLKFINLETAITKRCTPYPKGINYRMHPANAGCLTAAGIDGCSLANNHLLDWGEEGLIDTLKALRSSGLRAAGAGANQASAEAPAIFSVPGKIRVLFFSVAIRNSGVPSDWAAGEKKAGIAFLPDLEEPSIQRMVNLIRLYRTANDLVVLSLHWGDNWGMEVSPEERKFAHAMIDRGGVDLIHGHSSHHPRGFELYGRRPIFYGCGDLINDYEGIGGHEEYRAELGFLYFVTFNVLDRSFVRLELIPTHLRKLQLTRPSKLDSSWRLNSFIQESRKLGTDLQVADRNVFLARAA